MNHQLDDQFADFLCRKLHSQLYLQLSSPLLDQFYQSLDANLYHKLTEQIYNLLPIDEIE